MNIIKIAVKRRITVMMLFVCIVMLGLVSFGRLGMDLMPDMEIPVAMVMTTYSGAGSEEVESMITDTIELRWPVWRACKIFIPSPPRVPQW